MFRFKFISKTMSALVVLSTLTTLCGCQTAPSANKTNNKETKTAAAANDFEYWKADSKPKEVLTEFVENAVDPDSEGYIPVENRIAVFDMDGTLLSETNPYYFEWMMFFNRVLNDDTYTAPEEIKTFVTDVAMPAVYAGDVSDEIDAQFSQYQAKVYEGMSLDDYYDYVQDVFMNLPADGQENMTYGESFFMPMRNVVDYLQDNDFEVYVVSGADRYTTRAAVTKELGIPANHVIGSDTDVKGSKQSDEDEDGEFYTWQSGEEVVRTADLKKKNLKTNKVTAINREIGIQPVLAFGNSSGDESMALYTINDNEYPAEAFLILCDDETRDHGNKEKAASTKKMADKDGFNTISMEQDWTTIYPEEAKITDKSK
ncbi:HAD family hydrolase [Ileibacterium valens]|uniref:haloacid dehalogenase-like hydrolase n=1 Tax=Ileibacterium valens TaxID=1862668 RepID=UPI003517BD57